MSSAQAPAQAPAGEPAHVQADPSFKERVMGEAKKFRGQMMGNEELKNKGEHILDGTEAPSTKKKIEEQTGKSASELDVKTQQSV